MQRIYRIVYTARQTDAFVPLMKTKSNINWYDLPEIKIYFPNCSISNTCIANQSVLFSMQCSWQSPGDAVGKSMLLLEFTVEEL